MRLAGARTGVLCCQLTLSLTEPQARGFIGGRKSRSLTEAEARCCPCGARWLFELDVVCVCLSDKAEQVKFEGAMVGLIFARFSPLPILRVSAALPLSAPLFSNYG